MVEDLVGNFKWQDIINKTAKTVNGFGIGYVKKILTNYIIIEAQDGYEKFYFPKTLIDRFHADILWLRLAENDINDYREKKFRNADRFTLPDKGHKSNIIKE